MAEQKDEKSKLSLTGVVALLLALVSSVIIYQGPLKTSRPIDKEAEKSASIMRDRVQSRLWQDPFEAVSTHRQKENASRGSAAPRHHTSPGLVEGTNDARVRPDFMLLPVFVDGSPYASGAESRLRDRYALVSALGAAGYLPESGESIRFFEWQPALDEAVVVPAEWFVPGPRVTEPGKKSQVLVLWLKDQDVGAKPLESLAQLFAYLNTQLGVPASRYRILGPRTSGSLGAMLSELNAPPSRPATGDRSSASSQSTAPLGKVLLKDAIIYSSWATAADPVLLGETSGQDSGKSVEDLFKDAGLTLIRTIGTDDVLAEQLVEELTRRRIDLTIPRDEAGVCKEPCQIPHIALISEWDTLYGRALPRTFVAVANRLAERAAGKAARSLTHHFQELRAEQYPTWVHRYSYLAGLDGELPPKENGKDAGAGKSKPGVKGLSSDPVMEEAPVGRSQLDYLRRLVETLKREETTADDEFKAIGVLGSDVYDKLIILQALRNDFPHALFFTTDLDSRLTHPTQLPWTRNLVVASHFGLELDPRLQTPIPPFRDSYQTALFYSVLRAVDSLQTLPTTDDVKLSDHDMFSGEVLPRLYEVGRHGAVDLSLDGPRRPTPSHAALPSIHLPRPDVDPSSGALRLPSFGTVGRVLVAAILMLLCALLINSELWSLCRRRWFIGLVAAPILVAVIFAAFVTGAMLDGTGGEPFTFVDGISVWPTASLRLLAFLLCVIFFAHSWWRLRENDKMLIRRFRFRRPKAAVPPPSHPLIGIHYWRPEPAGHAQAALLWREYRLLGDVKERILRIVPQAIVYGGFGVVLMLQFGFPVMPCRGSACFILNYIILGCSVVAMTLLMFYVVDATRLCRRLIKIMIGTTIEWPDRLLTREAAKRGVDQAYVHEWLGIQFIAKRTAVISAMIYYPFVVVCLMGLARHSYFDRWDFPIGLMTIFMLNALYAFGNGVFLRRSAEQAKREAVAQLKRRLKSLSDEPVFKEAKRREIERMVELIEQTQEGAFLPFTRHPLFGAIALPTGGTGLVLLIEYLATIM